MTREKSSSSSSASASLAWPQVRAWLIANPDAVRSDAALLDLLKVQPPAPANVIEFGPIALARWQAAASKAESERRALEALGEVNHAAHLQTHDAVLELLEAKDFDSLAKRLDACAQQRFNLCGAVLALEGAPPPGWRGLPDGAAAELFRGRKPALLGAAALKAVAVEDAFPEAKSAAVLPLSLASGKRRGLVLFAHAAEDGFTPDMGAELLVFLTGVIERLAARWPL